MKLFRKPFIYFILFPFLSLAMTYTSNSFAYEEERGGQEHQYNQQHPNEQHPNEHHDEDYNRYKGTNDYHHGYNNQSKGNANINVTPNNQNSNPQYVEPSQEPDQLGNWNYFQQPQ